MTRMRKTAFALVLATSVVSVRALASEGWGRIVRPEFEVSEAVLAVDNEARGRSGHMGHALIDCDGGRILAFNSNTPTNRCDGHSGFGWMEYRVSSDYGRTWGRPRVLDYTARLLKEGRHTALCEKGVKAADGRVILFFQITDATRPISCEPWSAPTYIESLDDGETWSEAKQACCEAGRIYDAVVDRDSVYFLLPTSADFCASNQDYVVYKSTNGGPFVRHLTTIEAAEKGYGAMEFAADGSLIVYAYDRTNESGPQYCISRDRGETWEPPKRAYCAKYIRNPQLRRIGSDWFMCGRNGRNWCEPDRGNGLVLYHSKDGISWDEGVKVDERPAGAGTGYYSCLLPIFEPGRPPRLLMQYSHPYWRSSVNVKHRWIEPKAGGVLFMRFDDRSFANWERALPVFERYGAHATFFMHGPVDEKAVKTMQALKAHGHTIGAHSLRHGLAVNLIKEKGPDGYLAYEIDPQLTAIRKAGLDFRNFGYPCSTRDDLSDQTLYRRFDRLATGGYWDSAKSGKVETCDVLFFPVGEIASRRLIWGTSMSVCRPTITGEVAKVLRRLASRGEATMLYAHNIRFDGVHDDHDIKIDELEAILAQAKAMGVRVAGLDEFPYAGAAATSGGEIRFDNGVLAGRFDPSTFSLEVKDVRCGRVWRTQCDGLAPAAGVSTAVRAEGNELVFDFTADALAPVPPTFLAAKPMTAERNDRIFVPMGCGYSFPAEGWDFGQYVADWDMSRMRLYTGFMKMGCFAQYAETVAADGTVRQGAGVLTILETPVDAEVTFKPRSNGRLGMGVEWRGERGRFGYARRLRLVFFDQATMGAMAARYRAEMERRGLRVTFAEKAKRHPKLAERLRTLKGAPDIWYWTERKDKAAVARELRRMGFGNMLFSTVTRHDLGAWVEPDEVRELAEIPDLLATEYDIVHDAMEPEMLPKLDAVRPHWPPEVWERGDYVMDAQGKVARGWQVALKEDPSKPVVGCLKICQAQGGYYLRKRLVERLAQAPYSARFYDVTGTGIAECFNPRHPLTLRQSADARRGMLGIAGREFGLVTGTEEGLECFVPECDYLEGNFSAYTWRVDGGRYMWKTYEKSPDVMKYAIDPTTRCPFWEMVFHDCVSTFWYWTDYNNRFADTWWQRDALNAITGTAPMYFFTPEVFAAQKARLAESVKVAARTARETADAQLVDYQWLTADRLVQRSRFSNGVVVTVNFSDATRVLPDGNKLAPHAVAFGK